MDTMANLIIKEIQCKTAISKNGFPGGGWAINPYVGCAHNCAYCYARFIKRFTGHTEKWGSFVDVRINAPEVLKKQLQSDKYKSKRIYIGTVTDPYQPLEEKYRLTRKILGLLVSYDAPVSILTKSDLILRDLALLKKHPDLEVSFTINTLDENWKNKVEPDSPSVIARLTAAEKLIKNGVAVEIMLGPYWTYFTDVNKLFAEFNRVGIRKVFCESFNTVGGNWTGVEGVLQKYYPEKLDPMRKILFNPEEFNQFYAQARKDIEQAGKRYGIETVIYFGQGHAAKFKEIT